MILSVILVSYILFVKFVVDIFVSHIKTKFVIRMYDSYTQNNVHSNFYCLAGVIVQIDVTNPILRSFNYYGIIYCDIYTKSNYNSNVIKKCLSLIWKTYSCNLEKNCLKVINSDR